MTSFDEVLEMEYLAAITGHVLRQEAFVHVADDIGMTGNPVRVLRTSSGRVIRTLQPHDVEEFLNCLYNEQAAEFAKRAMLRFYEELQKGVAPAK